MGIFPLILMVTWPCAILSFISSDDTPLVDTGVSYITGGPVVEEELPPLDLIQQ